MAVLAGYNPNRIALVSIADLANPVVVRTVGTLGWAPSMHCDPYDAKLLVAPWRDESFAVLDLENLQIV